MAVPVLVRNGQVLDAYLGDRFLAPTPAYGPQGPAGPPGPQGVPGPEGPTAIPGPGFRLVGAELRYDIQSLPIG